MPTPHAPEGLQRLRGLALVALVHVLMIWALTSGLSHPLFSREKLVATVDLKSPDAPPPPEPLPRLEPTLKDPPIRQLVIDQPVIPEPVDRPPAIISIAPGTPGNTEATGAGSGVVEGPGHHKASAPTTAQIEAPTLICTRMATPEAPSVAWSGDAVLRILATVQAGRVSAVQLLAVQGSLDGRTRRALLASVERALREGYECPGEHRFEQEFRFKID